MYYHHACLLKIIKHVLFCVTKVALQRYVYERPNRKDIRFMLGNGATKPLRCDNAEAFILSNTLCQHYRMDFDEVCGTPVVKQIESTSSLDNYIRGKYTVQRLP